MRRIDPRRARALAAALAALALFGAGPSSGKGSSKRTQTLKSEETIGDLAIVRYNDSIRVEGVGLVVGLPGTGSEAEPSMWRTKLLDKMRKRSVPHAERWLSNNTPLGPRATSLVIVRGTIPAGITRKDVFDIDVELTPASATENLAGGQLMITELSVVQIVNGSPMEDQPIAIAGGPVLVTPEKPKVGKILGGARVKKDLPYTLVIKDERKSGRVSQLMQDVINLRFHEQQGIEQQGMAKAKTEQVLVLRVPRTYHDNQYRYFQVLERLPILDNPALRAKRQEAWAKELLDPKTAGQAALRLEGIGRNSVALLKAGLQSQDAQVRYFAAEALAYVGDPSGVDVLADAAVNRSEYRAHAFAALAALDDSAAQIRLRDLLAQADPKVRYGAFNALRIVDENDASLGRVPLIRDPEPPASDEAEEDMAMKLSAVPRRKAPRPEDPFQLYVVDCDGPPMVHVSRTRRCEIVVFGRGQKLLMPAVLGGAGPILINASSGDEELQITRIGTGNPNQPDLKTVCAPTLSAMLVETANLGATYPEILGILRSADRQKNLAGPLVEDAVPNANAAYDRSQLAGIDPARAKKDDAVGKAGLDAADGEKRPRKGGLLGRFRRKAGK